MNWETLEPVADTVGTLSSVLTVIALIVGGFFALTRYRREVRLRAADLLLKMEEEYRGIMPTCLDCEFLDRYEKQIVPVLNNAKQNKVESDTDIAVLARLDRCLRFFFLCTVLNSDLKVEETAIARAYYYYVCILAEPGKRTELQDYIAEYYPRLHNWMKRHHKCMERYRITGDWDWTLVDGSL